MLRLLTRRGYDWTHRFVELADAIAPLLLTFMESLHLRVGPIAELREVPFGLL